MKTRTRLMNAYANRYYHWQVKRRLSRLFVQRWHSGDNWEAGATGQPPVILLGMHRSGTTLLSKLLRPAGLHLGDWRGADTDESIYFQNLNEALLRLASASWDEPQPFVRALKNVRLSEAMAGALADYLNDGSLSKPFLGKRGESLFAQASPWGWKDPRTCYTLPLWLKLFPEAKVLFIHRNGVDVAQSLVHRNQRLMNTFNGSLRCTTLSGAFELWEMYNQQCLRWLAEVPATQQHTVSFENLMTAPEAELKAVCEFLHLSGASPDLGALAGRVNPKRAHAFRKTPALVDFYHAVADCAMMREFGYEHVKIQD